MNNKLFQAIAELAADLTSTERLVLNQLVYYSNQQGECWPRTRKVAKHVHRSLRRTQVALKGLRAKGYVEVLREPTPHRPPLYRIAVPGMELVQSDADARTKASPYRVQKSRGIATFSVPAQAGTKRELKKEQKEDHKEDHVHELPFLSLRRQMKEYDPSTMVPCAKRGCNTMTDDVWCNDHRPVGFYRKKMRG